MHVIMLFVKFESMCCDIEKVGNTCITWKACKHGQAWAGGPPKALWGTKYSMLGHETYQDNVTACFNDFQKVWKHVLWYWERWEHLHHLKSMQAWASMRGGGPLKALWGTKYSMLGHETSHYEVTASYNDVQVVWKLGQWYWERSEHLHHLKRIKFGCA